MIMKYLQKVQKEVALALDAKDKQLLRCLAEDARLPITQIAKKIRLSHDAVRYRLQQLEQSGVIQGYRTLVVAQRLGFEAYHVLLHVRQPIDPKKLVSRFQQNPHVRAVISFSGSYDYKIATVARNVPECDAIVNDILAACGTALQNYEILTIVKTLNTKAFPRHFLTTEDSIQSFPQQEIALDETDYAILSQIADNARLPLYSIAEKIKVSADTVHYRLKKMIHGGIILGFRPVINYAALDYSLYCLLVTLQNLTPEKEKKLQTLLHDDPNTIWAVKTIGRYNVMMYICIRKPADLHTTLDLLRQHFPELTNYEALLGYEEYKYTYFSEAMWKMR